MRASSGFLGRKRGCQLVAFLHTECAGCENLITFYWQCCVSSITLITLAWGMGQRDSAAAPMPLGLSRCGPRRAKQANGVSARGSPSARPAGGARIAGAAAVEGRGLGRPGPSSATPCWSTSGKCPHFWPSVRDLRSGDAGRLVLLTSPGAPRGSDREPWLANCLTTEIRVLTSGCW